MCMYEYLSSAAMLLLSTLSVSLFHLLILCIKSFYFAIIDQSDSLLGRLIYDTVLPNSYFSFHIIYYIFRDVKFLFCH